VSRIPGVGDVKGFSWDPSRRLVTIRDVVRPPSPNRRKAIRPPGCTEAGSGGIVIAEADLSLGGPDDELKEQAGTTAITRAATARRCRVIGIPCSSNHYVVTEDNLVASGP
jgi:hypothetical protein